MSNVNVYSGFMGTITVSVEDPVEESFRKTVTETIGKSKGSLGKAITEAMQDWSEKKKQKKIAKEMLILLDRGFEMGRVKKVSRAELHER